VIDRERSELFRGLTARAVPWMGHLHLTEECNLACHHCYRAGLPREKPLDGAEWIRLISEMKDEGTFDLVLSGGEPLLHPEWRAIITSAARLGFQIDLMTNGTHLAGHDLDLIAGLRIREIQFSIHGTEAVHDAFTGRTGAFASAWRAVEAARDRGIRTVVKMTLLKPTLDEAPRLAALCRGIGAIFAPSYFVIPRFLDRDQGFLAERLSAGEIRFVEAHHEEWTGRPPVSAGQDDCGATFCSMGWNRFAIGPHGEFHACSQDPAILDNVRGRSFREVWRQAPALNALRQRAGETLVECADCDLLAQCRFKCMGHFRQATGAYDAPAPAHCAITRAWAAIAA
jgi:radical SAM protein with 4Fe4S-binding SPASM domain